MDGIKSSTPTNLLSVKILVFNFYFIEVTIGHPQPNVTAPPV
jgi:hypothetical protein